MDEMIHHTKAVVRGAKNALIVGDMPFMTYQVSVEEALHNAARFIQEAGCQAVKLEGGEFMADTVRRVITCGIPVMGHIGLTPQSINQLGGYKAVGKTPDAAISLVKDAKALDEAGVFAIVLECVPEPLARIITERVSAPTIGIGAGRYCEGQVQVVSDVLGLYSDFVPKHAKQYVKLAEDIKKATADYISEVRAGAFPTDKQCFAIDEGVIAEVEKSV
jgi:3-methyl-2-oxobutanoate hydroxymethyltransferase